MSKKINISPRPTNKPPTDHWVESGEPVKVELPTLKTKRLTLDIGTDSHRKLKLHCVTNDFQIADLLRTLINREIGQITGN